MPVTQKDIAQNLGVSRELVKIALSGNGRISEESRERILKEAQRLGYNSGTNQGARALIASRYGKRLPTDIIAVMAQSPDFQGIAFMRIPYYIPFIAGIAQEASERDIDIHFCSPHKGRLPRLVSNEGVDGVITLGTLPHDLSSVNIPIINSGGRGNNWSGELEADYRKGAILATQHLIDLGHRNIAFLSFAPIDYNNVPYRAAANRLQGYYDTLERAGLKRDSNLVIDNIREPIIEAGIKAARELLARKVPFTAIICFNDLIAMGAIEVLSEHKLRVPEDVSIVGFDDVSTMYNFEPGLTSVSFDRFAMGRRAVELICARREKTTSEPVQYQEMFPVSLALRNSTSSPKTT